MSKLSESRGVFYMSDGIPKKSELILQENQLLKDIERAKEEKEAEEAAKLLLELQKKKQKEIEEKLQTLELLPMNNKIIILPYPENPYKKVIEGNIIVEYDGSFMNPDSGQKDKMQTLVGCAKVIEVGPECKYLKPGDDVYYDTRTTYPVPFMSLGYQLTTEPQILCVLNSNLKERFNMNQ